MGLPVQTRATLWLIVIGGAVAVILDWSLNRTMTSEQGGAVGKHDAPAVKRASASLPELFSTYDYPQTALRNNEQGTVAFNLAINEHGRVERCYVAESSGSAALDHATCAILTRRARFTPARSADGEAVADFTTGRIKWLLPD